ncbi:hypothetical protein [Caballeronia sp. TF1N1]|uniref:hypothetical protein n=1 Tax=Caballeronia sp. TF1N1 TaxID=2878153 RepID=UPI001FD0B592|nr:hypothetical protein [Caballeronia sp. TF1N1]
MPKKTFGVQLLLLVAVAGGALTWKSAGYFHSEIAAADHGAKAVNAGRAFARKVLTA